MMRFLRPQLFTKTLETLGKFPFANMPTSGGRMLHQPRAIERVYTRDYLENYNKNPNFEQDRKKEAIQAKKDAYSQSLLQRPSHDKNPSNFIPVVQKEAFLAPEARFNPLPRADLPLYQIVEPRKPKIFIEGVRRQVPSKLKKLLPPMRRIIGLHLYEALALMQGHNKKTYLYIAKTLQQVRNHAINRGFDETRLYVAQALTGKHRRSIGLRYRGKGGSGRAKHDTCQLRIKLEEKPYEDLFKDMIWGHTPPVIAYSLRENAMKNNLSYEEIRKKQWVLTGKGRQQARLMLKRRIQLTFLENLKQGRRIPKKIITQRIVDSEAKGFAEKIRELNNRASNESLAKRQELFRKNEEKSV